MCFYDNEKILIGCRKNSISFYDLPECHPVIASRTMEHKHRGYHGGILQVDRSNV